MFSLLKAHEDGSRDIEYLEKEVGGIVPNTESELDEGDTYNRCEPCLRKNCGECKFCKDMPRNHGLEERWSRGKALRQEKDTNTQRKTGNLDHGEGSGRGGGRGESGGKGESDEVTQDGQKKNQKSQGGKSPNVTYQL